MLSTPNVEPVCPDVRRFVPFGMEALRQPYPDPSRRARDAVARRLNQVLAETTVFRRTADDLDGFAPLFETSHDV